MNFFNRALKYCWRQRLRSFLLLLTFTLLSTTVLIAISSEKAVEQGTKQIKETVGASVRIELDTNNQANYGSAEDFGNGASGYTYNGDFITEKIVDKISKLENVIGYNAKSSEGYWGVPKSFSPFPAMVTEGLATPYQAVLNSSLDTRFLNGTYKLEEGRHIKADDSYVALISKELADKNNLSVGDTIEFITETDIDITDTTFKIIGIFSGTEGMSKSAITPSDIPANLGYIDMNSLSELYDSEGYDFLDVYTHTPEEAKELMETIKNLPEVEKMGLTKEEMKRNVLQLSGGQQQRVAIARALASEAPVILADEPTGNLDEDTAMSIMQIMENNVRQMNKCAIIVTHSNEIAKRADVILQLKRGTLQRIENQKKNDK